MSEQLASSMEKVFEIVLPLAVVAVTLAIGYIIRKITFERLAKWSKNTASELRRYYKSPLSKARL